mmetsp:Transcript_2544/g.8119  ORF Transcript_2544/g.8119 Transcript_2544/m.8119 type:complete len:183 (-) Transcript_2544:15-563(-)
MSPLFLSRGPVVSSQSSPLFETGLFLRHMAIFVVPPSIVLSPNNPFPLSLSLFAPTLTFQSSPLPHPLSSSLFPRPLLPSHPLSLSLSYSPNPHQTPSLSPSLLLRHPHFPLAFSTTSSNVVSSPSPLLSLLSFLTLFILLPSSPSLASILGRFSRTATADFDPLQACPELVQCQRDGTRCQ